MSTTSDSKNTPVDPTSAPATPNTPPADTAASISTQPPETVATPTTPSESEQQASPTALPSSDQLGLGRTSGQRGAEILAGLRAELIPSPTTKALARFSGQLVARLMIQVMGRGNVPGMNYIAVRTSSLAALIKEFIADQKDVLLVEIAAGFSPRGLELALALPQAQVIEIDLPDVVQEKRKRLEKGRDVTIPPNLSWREADMGVVSLKEVLEGKVANVITAEGLMPYFPHEQQVRIAQQVYENLTPRGLFLADMTWHEGVQKAEEGTRFFSRQAGKVLGTVKTKEEAATIFTEAGYQNVDVHLPSELAERYNLLTPVLDFQLLVAAQKKVAGAEPAVPPPATPKAN